jgi:peptidoglycan/LPS O-acetylase OafA/YrhL
MINENRIDILDSFRFIAIISVMLFHYYSRYIPPLNKEILYPYGNFYDYFNYGYLGVQFFFIISGFVIAFTLTKTTSFPEFWKKRIIRLFPAMLFCSIVTFLVFFALDNHNLFSESHSLKNFMFSLTFISPDLVKEIGIVKFGKLDYLNGSYWSLWPEIQFYLVASCIYFVNKKHFVFNIVLFTLITWFVNYIVMRVLWNVQTTNKFHLNLDSNSIVIYRKWTEDIFNYINYSFYFILGVLFFQLHSNGRKIITLILLSLLIAVRFYYYGELSSNDFTPVYILGLMITVFICFSYFPGLFKFLSGQLITKIGVASYSLYLIHEYIGVLLINRYASILGKFNFLFPILLIIAMIIFSLLLYKFVEKPIGIYLKKMIIK